MSMARSRRSSASMKSGKPFSGAHLNDPTKRLSIDMPELMEEVVAFIERRTAELNEGEDGAAPRPTESVVPAALVRATPTLQDDDTGIATISLRFDTQVLARVDAAAKRLGISRTAWLHVAAGERLEGPAMMPTKDSPGLCDSD